MSTKTVSESVAEAAHEKVSVAEEALNDIEHKVREGATIAGEKAEQYSEEAKQLAGKSITSLEQFVREKPLQAAGIAFAAGLLTAMVLRKK